jgi:hypothetical protein
LIEKIKDLQEMNKEERLTAFLEELRLVVNRMNIQSNPGTIMKIAGELSSMIRRGPEHDEHYRHLQQFLDYRNSLWKLCEVIYRENQFRSTTFNSPEFKTAFENAVKALENEGIHVDKKLEAIERKLDGHK